MTVFRDRPVPHVDAVAAHALLGEAVLLDVREPDEWAAGHAPDAWFVPLGELESARFQLPVNRRIVCVCRSGQRSALATDLLLQWAFDAVNLEGGMQAWAAAGLPVVRDDGSPGTVI